MKYDKFPKDFKKIVVNYYLSNGSLRKTSKLFKCSKSSLFDWISRDLNKDKIYNNSYPKKYTAKIEKFIIRYVENTVTPTLKQNH